MQNAECRMQNAECRVNDNFRLERKFPFYYIYNNRRKPTKEVFNLNSALLILHSALKDKPQFNNLQNTKKDV